MKQWMKATCGYCNSLNDIVIVDDVVKYKCHICSKSQLVNVGRKEVPKIEVPIVKPKKKRFADVEVIKVNPIIDDDIVISEY